MNSARLHATDSSSFRLIYREYLLEQTARLIFYLGHPPSRRSTSSRHGKFHENVARVDPRNESRKFHVQIGVYRRVYSRWSHESVDQPPISIFHPSRENCESPAGSCNLSQEKLYRHRVSISITARRKPQVYGTHLISEQIEESVEKSILERKLLRLEKTRERFCQMERGNGKRFSFT